MSPGANRIGCWTSIALTVVLLSGCLQSYGRLKHTPEMTASFRSGTVLDGHRYYSTGRSNMPYALIALADPYRQVSKRWELIEPDSSRLAKLARSMFDPPDDTPPRASAILDPQGRPMGVYYSGWYWTTIEFKSDTEVLVYSPYDPNDRNIGP